MITLATSRKKECIDITERVREIVRASGVKDGLCHVQVLHTTAALIVNEKDDPNIAVDLLRALDMTIPEHDGWLHDQIDNNAQSHIQASMLGSSQLIPVRGGDLKLGTWQGILFLELDGPRPQRHIVITLVPGSAT
jgi:secondary thiamine-phosphate synthase enzyme